MYTSLLSSLAKKQWERIGLKRRSGIVTGLFSLYSGDSAGIGELPDLDILADWCVQAGMSIIQLLPMNDVGFDFRPYDAQSTFALDPMYLALDRLTGIDTAPFKKDLKALRKKFPAGKKKVDYRIKGAKLELLWKMFKSAGKQPAEFDRYLADNKFWIEDYALFKVIKDRCGQKDWETWEPKLKSRDEDAIRFFVRDNAESILFHQWMQWQLYQQFRAAKAYAAKKGVLIMGDLPFLVSRDSADVWSHQGYFKLNLSSGAPPDMYFALGQRWGMPVYNWENIARHKYDYLTEKLRYAQNFYDLYRIDHVVGMFRVWTIALSEPPENAGLHGVFDPKDEKVWEEHGRTLLSIMVKNTEMLPCAEDLGVVPPCSNKVLEEMGIPGIEVQRWIRDWGKTYEFKKGEDYRKNAVATVATHDSTSFVMWWKFDAGTADAHLFKRKCEEKHVAFEHVKGQLFDLKKSHHGRLRWKNEIADEHALMKALNLPEDQAKDLAKLYRESYGEKEKFWEYLGMKGKVEEDASPEFVRRTLEKVCGTASIFTTQLLQDWFALDEFPECGDWGFRINFPGTLSDKNWSIVMPLSLEEMLKLPINKTIKSINKNAGRI